MVDAAATPLRQRLAKNLRYLLIEGDTTAPQIAAKAKIDPKSMNNLLHARFNPRLGDVEKVAKAMGWSSWHLLAFDMTEGALDKRELLELLDIYARLNKTKRDALLTISRSLLGTLE